MPSLAFRACRVISAEIRKAKNRILNRTLNLVDTPVVVLMYHRVTAMESDFHSLAVLPDNFRAHLEYLKRNFQLVRFEDDWTTVQKPAVAITFDDGYADNAQIALPIIEEVGVPVTFFISTANIGSKNEFWWDALERMVLGEADYPARFVLDDPQYGKTWPTATSKERRFMFWELHQSAKKISAAQRAGWLRQVGEWAGLASTPDEANRLMTQDELRSLAQSQWVTIGAHTVTHPMLSALTEAEQRQEIVSSRQQLEKLLGREIEVFSYPFGDRCDYDTTTRRICREAGFRKAAAAFSGEVHPWSDPYQIPRHSIPNWDLKRFAVELKSLGVC